MAHNFVHFDILAECSPVNTEKYAALLSILMKKFENRFQDCWIPGLFWGMSATAFSININIWYENSQMECIQNYVSLSDFYKFCLTREK